MISLHANSIEILVCRLPPWSLPPGSSAPRPPSRSQRWAAASFETEFWHNIAPSHFMLTNFLLGCSERDLFHLGGEDSWSCPRCQPGGDWSCPLHWRRSAKCLKFLLQMHLVHQSTSWDGSEKNGLFDQVLPVSMVWRTSRLRRWWNSGKLQTYLILGFKQS